MMTRFQITTALTCGVLALAGCVDNPGAPAESETTAPLTAISCGPTANDTAIASALADVWGGNLTGARIACGRRVVAQVRARGLTPRAAEIAIETVLVESGMLNLDGGDRDSVGLFQQRASWGTFAERTNPEHATDSFLDVMAQFFPNGSWASHPRGDVAQAVQRSAFPDRYEQQTTSAIAIVAALWTSDLGWAQVVHADLDGNGDDELGFYTTRDGTFAWYPMTATGQLGTRLSASDLGDSWDVILGVDPDGDGVDDLAFYNAKSGAFDVYPATPSGTLGARRSSTLLGAGWTSIIAADFDGDHHDELAFYNAANGAYAVYHTNPNGTLGARLTAATFGTGWTELAALDVTGDGHPELALYNKANGSFAVYPTTAAGALGSRLSAATLSKGWTAVEPVRAASGTSQLAFYDRATGGFSIYMVDATGQLGTRLASFTLN